VGWNPTLLGGLIHRNSCAVHRPGVGNPRRTSCSTLGWVQADSEARTTFPLDEKTPVFNGTCWSLAGEDYETSDWVQSRGRRKADSRHREARRTRQVGEATRRVGHPDQDLGVLIRTDRGRLHPTVTKLDSGATLSVYMDDILITELAHPRRSRNCPVPSPETAGLRGQIVDEVSGSTPPYEERPGTNSRTRTTSMWVEVVRG
jgi:hypothetical protein